MKEKIFYFLFVLAVVIVACDPMEDRDTMTGTVSADELDLSATPIVVDGMNTNKVVLENHSPVLSWWDYGLGTSQNATDTIKLVVAGTATITFTGLNGDGSEVSKELTVDVDTLYYEVDPQWGYLCGEGEKTWTWNTSVTSCFGNGGYLGDTAPAWWALSIADIDEQAEGEGEGATMVFSTSGATLTKNLTDGSSESGTFSFDMTETTNDDSGVLWSSGGLNTTGVTVLCGISINEGGIDVDEYDILELTDETLTLSYHADGTGSWGEAWFWLFTPAE